MTSAGEPVSEWDAVVATLRTSPGHRFLRRYSDEVNRRLLRRWLDGPRPGRLLKTDLFDEAAGEGLYPELQALAGAVVAIDVAPEVVAAARINYPELEAAVADVRTLPFPDASVDAVVSNSTLDHFASLEEVAAALRELARVLRPGGRLVVTLDNPLNPLVALRNRLPYEPLHRVGLVPYSVGATCGPRRLAALLRREGFRVQRVVGVIHFPRALARAAAAATRRDAAAARLLRAVSSFEGLRRTPLGYVTGQFVAALAVKDGAAD